MVVRFAPKREVDVVRREQFESSPTLQVKGWRRRLVEFRFVLGNLRERHRGVAGLEGDRAVASQILVAVEDMFQVQP